MRDLSLSLRFCGTMLVPSMRGIFLKSWRQGFCINMYLRSRTLSKNMYPCTCTCCINMYARPRPWCYCSSLVFTSGVALMKFFCTSSPRPSPVQLLSTTLHIIASNHSRFVPHFGVAIMSPVTRPTKCRCQPPSRSERIPIRQLTTRTSSRHTNSP